MKSVLLSFVFLLLIFQNCKSTTHQKVLNLKDSNIENVKDVTPLVVEAIAKCKKEGINVLQFPKGIYHFYPTFAPDKYCAITNNDNGLKRSAFPLINFENFEINGNGSEFIFHGKMIPFIIEESDNIKIKNLSINWEVPFNLEAEVVANNAVKKTFDIKPKTPYKVENGHLYLSLEREESPYEQKHGFRFARLEKYNLEIGQNIIWDPNTMAPYYNTSSYGGFDFNSYQASEISEGLVRMYSNYDEVPPIGSIFCSKGEYLFNRTSPAFRLFKSKDLYFKNVNVHHAGAMGLIAERCENITLDSFNVVLNKGEDRMVTTTADATHFCNCKGLITMKNCIFENMLDDATNIHGTYVRVNKVLDDYNIAIETYHPHQNDYLFCEVGDSLQAVHKNTLVPTTKPLIVKNVKRVNEKITVLTFEESINGKIEKYFGIENISWYPSAILENNIVRNNRARGFLVSTPRKVEIRNNYFSTQMASLRITGDLDLWNESGPSDTLIIENNVFENSVYAGNGPQSIIMIDPQYRSEEDIHEKYSSNIIIKDNKIRTFDSSILLAVSVDGLVFERNTIEQTNKFNPLFPNQPNLNIINCDNVVIGDNTYKSLTRKKGTIKVDEKTKNINLINNHSFIKVN